MADYPLSGSLGYGLWAIRTGKFGSIVHIVSHYQVSEFVIEFSMERQCCQEMAPTICNLLYYVIGGVTMNDPHFVTAWANKNSMTNSPMWS